MSIASGIFAFLHSETQRTFGEGSYLFFPAERGGSTYTVIVPCTAAANRGKSKGLAGVLTLAADTRIFDVAAAAVPFEPRPDDIVLYGTAIEVPGNPGTFMADPNNPPVKYCLTGADNATFQSHWRLIAERH